MLVPVVPVDFGTCRYLWMRTAPNVLEMLETAHHCTPQSEALTFPGILFAYSEEATTEFTMYTIEDSVITAC